jgi:exoribonuclease R
VQAFGKPILLVGRESMNRAIDGDVVVVEMLPEAEWKAPGQEVLDQDGKVAEAIHSRLFADSHAYLAQRPLRTMMPMTKRETLRRVSSQRHVWQRSRRRPLPLR